jgi:penicillin-binding protein 1A
MKTNFRARIESWLDRIPIEPRHRPLAAALLTVALLMLGGVGLYRTFSVSCPPEARCVTLRELEDSVPLPEALRIYDREGELLAEVAGPLRRSLPADRMPELMAEAFVTVEDRRFWNHQGVDTRGVMRAMVENLRNGGIEEGASTIPMQLVRTLWAESLREVGPWRRKIIEARTAPRLIDVLGHERLLVLYLNAIYLGNGIYGVERASRYYFGSGANDLTLGQTATLVGITRSPEYYEPRRHPERARSVRDVVLRLLATEGVIEPAEAEEAMAADLGVVPLDSVELSTERTHLTAAVTRELRQVAPELSNRQGLEIHTTIHGRIQREGETALANQLAAIDSGRYGALVEPTDSMVPLEGAAVALDPTTSAVLAWVGGREFSRSEFDRVDQARRQVGSLVKPFLVALAVERGYGIVDMVSSDTIPITTDEGGWLPADHVLETSIPLREALIRSSNRAAAHLGMTLGLDNLVSAGVRAGIDGPIPALPSTSIGAFDASLLEMVSAYSIFGNGGIRTDPYLIERVVSDSIVLWERTEAPEYTQVIDEGTAYVVLDAMRAVVDRGTGASVRGVGYRGPAAGKTGTTNDGRDAWFVGLTPEIVAGVWVGYDTPRPIVEDRGGGALAAPAWGMWMRSLTGQIPQRRAWIPPPSVERVRYDPVMGGVIGPHCRFGPGDAVYQDAWVIAGDYDRRCPDTGIRGWFDRAWRTLVPGDVEPVRPIPLRRRGGR